MLQATISKTGTIENLHVISGPPMLTAVGARCGEDLAIQALLLNGEPVEVETTVNVIFNLGG